jgi:hypothetical protein
MGEIRDRFGVYYVCCISRITSISFTLILVKNLCNKVGRFVIKSRKFDLEMKEIQILLESQGYRNFHVSEKRFPTIWGGTSLLDMFLFVIKWSFANQYFKSWDYIFNVSESDFPVLSLAELEAILAE